MDIFRIHREIVEGYRSYIESFVDIHDDDIRERVEKELARGTLWPEPLIQFNPSYERNLSVSDLVSEGILVSELEQIFKGFELYTHQVEALRLGAKRKSFVVTSGTGSGKSLRCLGSVFDHLLRGESAAGIKAVLVYPMNALINSQVEELNKFRENYERNAGKPFPVSYNYLPEHDRVRYTIHPDARKEVLKRLLLLNHERYDEEVKLGLHDKKVRKVAAKSKKRPKQREKQADELI